MSSTSFPKRISDGNLPYCIRGEWGFQEMQIEKAGTTDKRRWFLPSGSFDFKKSKARKCLCPKALPSFFVAVPISRLDYAVFCLESFHDLPYFFLHAVKVLYHSFAPDRIIEWPSLGHALDGLGGEGAVDDSLHADSFGHPRHGGAGAVRVGLEGMPGPVPLLLLFFLGRGKEACCVLPELLLVALSSFPPCGFRQAGSRSCCVSSFS